MALDFTKARGHLKNFDFEPLFIDEMGWDRHDETMNVSTEGKDYTLHAIVHKRGMVTFLCDTEDQIPPYPIRRKIELEVAKSIREHLVIYIDSAKQVQIWQWVKREIGKPVACREHAYQKDQPGDALLQKLQSIAFSLEEEDELNIVDITQRVRAAFDLDKITKKFYEQFKKEHNTFLDFIDGIDDVAHREWYASIMLNRLMFIYFIQKKGFLDNDPNYLQNRLGMMREKKGKDKFFTFYRHFLLRLFHEGLGQQKRTAELDELLGKVPYLNGGLFDVHELEKDYSDIHVPDNAFERIFSYFDKYQWHLDERPLRSDNEINPDVLGYIFEKYINQKQMGAYYTKEDITDYISKNAIVPRIFDMVEKDFGSIEKVWDTLKQNSDRYIYDDIKKGVELDLPEDVKVGEIDLSKRKKWNELAYDEFALPTEIWREVIERRQHYKVISSKLHNGEINSINDLITYNLDIQQLAQDTVESIDDSKFLLSFFNAVVKISVLDPTCGSGAFLFSALNILESLYEACLERMRAFELEREEDGGILDKYREILKKVEEHPNQRYFILKSIILNNLYGVDIMDEAVEICKLRFFLKLVAQLEKVEQVEPLPDIDFNIRSGNTLVGFTSRGEVKKAIFQAHVGQTRLVTESDMKILEQIEKKAEKVEEAYRRFKRMQTQKKLDHEALSVAKKELRQQTDSTKDELDKYLASEYGIKVVKGGKIESYEHYKEWINSHKPFHWFIEFYEIMRKGGFDSVIGNPPYVSYNEVKKQYTIRTYKTESSGNLYCFCIERGISLIKKNKSYFSLIVPISLVGNEKIETVRKLLLDSGDTWFSHFSGDTHPGTLFTGVQQNLCIFLFKSSESSNIHFTTDFLRFADSTNERSYLFTSKIRYEKSKTDFENYQVKKFGSNYQKLIFNKLKSEEKTLKNISVKEGECVYYHDVVHYWVKCFVNPPHFQREGEDPSISSHYKCLKIPIVYKFILPAILSTSVYYMWYISRSNGRDVSKEDVLSFPLDLKSLSKEIIDNLKILSTKLYDDLETHKKMVMYQKKSGKVEYDQYWPENSKDVMDEIDKILATHYNFTDEEIDFIINYDIKYRIGIGP